MRLALVALVLAALLLASGAGGARATGNGQFNGAATYPAGRDTHDMATGDVNNDVKRIWSSQIAPVVLPARSISCKATGTARSGPRLSTPPG